MSDKDKLIDKIMDEIQRSFIINKKQEMIVIIGQREYSTLQTVDASIAIDNNRKTVMGHKYKVLPMDSTLQVMTVECFNLLLDMHKRDLLDSMSRTKTLLRDA